MPLVYAHALSFYSRARRRSLPLDAAFAACAQAPFSCHVYARWRSSRVDCRRDVYHTPDCRRLPGARCHAAIAMIAACSVAALRAFSRGFATTLYAAFSAPEERRRKSPRYLLRFPAAGYAMPAGRFRRAMLLRCFRHATPMISLISRVSAMPDFVAASLPRFRAAALFRRRLVAAHAAT